MYRNGKTYDEIAEVVIDIFIDYEIRSFPVDPKDICRKLGVALVPYSEYGDEQRKLLEKRSRDGFFVKKSLEMAPTIYYNDRQESEGRIRFTIFHELKHYVCEDDNDDKDDLADYFARYFMCPIPFLLLKKIDTPPEIMAFCGTSPTVASNVHSNIVNRKRRYGYKLFDYEVRLVGHLEPVLIEAFHQNREQS